MYELHVNEFFTRPTQKKKTFQNKRLANIIYGSSWYRFPIAEQKDICRALLRVQSSKELWMGPLAPLNLETSSKVNATDN